MLYPPHGKWSGASIIHDYLYAIQTRSRKEADEIFYEALGVLGVPEARRYALYLGVRSGGFVGWNIRTKKLTKRKSRLILPED